MTFTRRMKLGFGALIAVMGIMIALNGSQLIWINNWEGHTRGTLEESGAANQMAASISSMRADVSALSEATARGYGQTEAKEAFATDGAAVTSALESVLGSTKSSSADVAALENIGSLLDQYQSAGDALFALAGSDPTTVPARITPVSELGNQLSDAATAFQGSRLTLGMAKLDRLDLMASVCVILQVVLGVLAFFGGIAFAVLLTRKISGALKEAVSSISSTASELMAVASQVAASAGQTAASTNETMATVEEMKQTATLAHEKASEIAESGENVTRIAESGRAAMAETMGEIERMQGQMGAIGEAVARLSEQTQAVQDVIATVNDLAEQSNLLSVNASIEAAKAGEYGRGFSVVAQEVKSLAEQSKQAVTQIRTILGEVLKSAGSAVLEAEKGREAMEVGARQSHEAGEAIRVLAESVANGAKSAGEHILASSWQQLAAMDQIGQAIDSINQATTQSVSGTKQVEQEVGHLQELALQLKHMTEIETTA